MARKIQVSFKELTTGSYFSIVDPTGDAETIKIDVVDSDPILFQVINTDDVPIDTKTEVSMQRVSDELQSSTFVTNVSYEGTLMTIEVADFLANQIDLTWSGSFRFVSITILATDERLDKDNETDGVEDYTGQLFEPFINNIRIDYIEHKLSNFNNYDIRQNIAANFGDRVRTKIFFTSAEDLSSLSVTPSFKFYYGYIEKDESPYSNVDDYQIDINKFKDPYQDSVTQFTRDLPTVKQSFEDMNHVSPKWGQYGNASLYDYDDGTNRYAILFDHYVPFLPREDDYDLNNYTIPEDVNGGKTLKPIFQIDIINDKASNAAEQSTNRTDLTNFFDRGSVGFYDQVFQTGDKFYSLTEGSLVFNNGTIDVDKIDSSRDTTVSFTIEMDDPSISFTSTDEIILHIQDVNLATSEAAKRKTFTDNQRYDSVLRNTNNSPGSSTRITQFKAEIDATDLWKINCTAVIPKLQVTDFYNLWCSVSRDYNNTTPLMTAQNIYLQSEVAEAGGDESVIYMDLYDTTTKRTDFNFFSHWQTNPSELSGSFNEVLGFPEDHYACRFRIVNEDAARTILTDFSVRLVGKDSGVVYENYKFDVINGSNTPRGWNLEQQFQNEVTFTPNYGFELGKDEYFVNYAFQIDSAWSDIDDIVLEWRGTYNQTLDDGTEVSFTTYVQSPNFKIGTYNETENTDLEPNTLNNNSNVEFFEYTGGVIGNKVSKVIEESGSKTLVRYTFTDDNLDDLQAVPSSPLDYTFLLANKTEGNLTGYLDLVPQGGGVSERWRFHNFEENTASFWESVTGHPDQGYAKIRRTDIKTATIEAVIDGTKFVNQFQKIPTCYNFSARIDKVQTSPAGLDVDTDVYVIIDTSSFIGVEAAAVAEERVNNWFMSYVLQTRQTNSPFVGNLYKIYPQMGAFRANYACERWLCYINICANNREEVDLSNPIPDMPTAYNAIDTRYLAYAPGLVTCMRAVDINENTVVKTEADGITNSGALNVYYSSFFDEVGGNLTHTEKILDFFTNSTVRTITFSGVTNRTVVSSSTNNNVLRYNLSGLNGSFDINLLNFKGFYNEGNSTDITQEYDGTPLTDTITPSGKCLFIPFIEDIIGNSLNTNGYSFYDPTTIGDIRMLERSAFNTAGADTFNETLPTFIFQKDYEAYKNITTQVATKYGAIVYPPQAIDRTPSDNISVGIIGALHLHILRALKGSNITLSEMKESTLLEYYDINGLGGLQNYPNLTSLDTAAAGKLFSNTDAVGFNNLENDGITAVYDFGSFLSNQPAWSNVVTYNTGDKVSQGGLEYTSLIDNNIGNTPSAGSNQWDITGGKCLLAGIDQNTFNSQITNGINSL